MSEEDTYLARLAPLLEAGSPGVAWEVVNTAVPGYNTVMEVETLEAKGLRYDRDLVVLNFVGNDLGLPNFVEEEPDVLSLRRSFLVDFVRSRLAGAPAPGRRLVGVSPEARRFGGEADVSRVPARYRALAGLPAFRSAMERLHDLAREHGVEDTQQPPLTITPEDPHPSPLGHSIIAAVLAEHLRSSGLADRLAARRRASAPAP